MISCRIGFAGCGGGPALGRVCDAFLHTFWWDTSDILSGADTPSRERADGRGQVSAYFLHSSVHLTATARGALALNAEVRTRADAIARCQAPRKRWTPARAKTVMEGTNTGLARDARTTTARLGDSAVAEGDAPIGIFQKEIDFNCWDQIAAGY